MKIRRGLLIAFEGLDKTGKTTHSKLLSDALNTLNIKSLKLRFPDRNTELGKLLDSYLKKQIDLNPEVSHMLFSANRWEVKDKLIQYLQNGTNIILDRYIWSGVAYSSALGIDYEWAKMSDKGLPLPDITFLMRCRNLSSLGTKEKFGEQRYQKQQFQSKVMRQYDRIIMDNKKVRIVTVDSEKSIQENHLTILNTLKQMH